MGWGFGCEDLVEGLGGDKVEELVHCAVCNVWMGGGLEEGVEGLR